MIAPELIKVEAIPIKVVYDFSKIKPEDLKKLEIELRKKQKKRNKRE